MSNKKMIYLLIIIGSLVTLAVTLGIQYYSDKGSEEDKKEIIKEGKKDTEKVLNLVSGVKTDIELLKANQEAFQIYIHNSLNPSLPNILSEKGYTIKQLEKLANQAIENSKDFFELGNAYFVKGNFEKAIVYFEKSSENAPNKTSTNIEFNLGQAKFKLIEKKYNIDFINSELLPKKAKPLLNEIINHYAEVIIKNPNNYQAYNNRGVAYTKLELFDKAEFDFEKAKNLNPNSPNSYVNLAKYYISKNNLNYINSAFQLLNKAIEIDSTFHAAYYNRGNIYEKYFNDFQKAIQDYKECIKLGFNSKHVYNNMGIAYARWGKCDLAEENFNLALKIDPSFQKSITGKKKIEVLRKTGKCE